MCGGDGGVLRFDHDGVESSDVGEDVAVLWLSFVADEGVPEEGRTGGQSERCLPVGGQDERVSERGERAADGDR